MSLLGNDKEITCNKFSSHFQSALSCKSILIPAGDNDRTMCSVEVHDNHRERWTFWYKAGRAMQKNP
jgi:hypothetical protein